VLSLGELNIQNCLLIAAVTCGKNTPTAVVTQKFVQQDRDPFQPEERQIEFKPARKQRIGTVLEHGKLLDERLWKPSV